MSATAIFHIGTDSPFTFCSFALFCLNWLGSKKTPDRKEIFKKEEISFDLVFLDEGIDMIQESQHTFIEYKTLKEVIDTGTLIMMLTRAGAVLYFEKKNATKTQYEGIREIFEKKNILCKMKNI